jgi:hypothetical protein
MSSDNSQRRKEGVRRLSLTVGGGLALLWTVFYVWESLSWRWPDNAYWWWLMGAGVAWFGGILLVRGLAGLARWLYVGFKAK